MNAGSATNDEEEEKRRKRLERFGNQQVVEQEAGNRIVKRLKQ
jgi:hypothetical protein